MGFLIKFLLLFALLGATFGYLCNGKTKQSAGDGAASGILLALFGLLQLFLIGILALAGIWLVSRIL
jgi:hypothetical protein